MALDISSINLAPQPYPEAYRQAQSSQAKAVAAEAARENLKSLVEETRPSISAANRRLAFSINSKLEEVVVKVIDDETDKVVREIPPAELQHVYERIREVVGLLFDSRA